MMQIEKTGFGERLKSERDRLKLSLKDFGSLGSVNRMTQMRYENGVNFPTVGYLDEIGKHDVDVLYLLTGDRSAQLEPVRNPAGFVQTVRHVDAIAMQHNFEMPPDFQVRAILRTYEQILKVGPKKAMPTLQELVAESTGVHK